jgi:thiol-disulfide isomerase/thioredoxin
MGFQLKVEWPFLKTKTKNMKYKVQLLFFILPFFLMSYTEDDDVVIEGTVSFPYDGVIYLYSQQHIGDVSGYVYVDSTFVESGSFTLKEKEYLNGLSIVTLADRHMYARLILEKGNINMQLKAPKMYSKISGTSLNDLFQQYVDSCAYYAQKLTDAGFDGYIKYDSEIGRIWLSYGQCVWRYKEENITNATGRAVFLNEINDGVFDRCIHNPDSVNLEIIKKGGLEEHSSIIAYLKKKEKAKANKAAPVDLIGTQYKDFELFDPAGEKYKLSDFVGKSKFLLIDFWASWCAPCIRDMPELKKLYEKYKDQGLEIISISIDIDKENWLKGIERVNVPWKHLSNLQYRSDLTKFYNLSGIPYAVLLDKSGTIISLHSLVIKQMLPELIKNN